MPKCLHFIPAAALALLLALGAGAAVAGGDVLIGGDGDDTVINGDSGPVILDGTHYSGIEMLNFANGQPNAISLFASVFAKVDNGVLQVDADPNIDSLILDGCYTWDAEKDEGNYAVWRGTRNVVAVIGYVAVTRGVRIMVGAKCLDENALKQR